jgi:hypothetical protein
MNGNEIQKIESTQQKQLILWIKKELPEITIKSNKLENKKIVVPIIKGYEAICKKIQITLDKWHIVKIAEDKRMGAPEAGTPDLTLTLDYKEFTYILELELKTLKGRLNDNQVDWWAKFRPTKNRKGKTAYGFLDAQKIINNWVDSIKNFR